MLVAVKEEDSVGRLTVLEEEIEDNPADNIYYVERFCSCGSVRKMRGRHYQLFDDAGGVITGWDEAHKDLPHMPVSEEEALKVREVAVEMSAADPENQEVGQAADNSGKEDES